MDSSIWTGLRFPARILTSEETALLTPICSSCSLPGLIVELQVPLTSERNNQPLIEFLNDELKFYCAYHSPITVPPELTEQTDYACYERLRVEVFCRQRGHKKFIANCIRMQPRCLKRCEPVHDIAGDVPLGRLQETVEKGRAIELRRKAEKENGSKQGT